MPRISAKNRAELEALEAEQRAKIEEARLRAGDRTREVDPNDEAELPADDQHDVDELTILDVMTDPKLFGGFFEPRWTWRAWITFLTALFGLPLRAAKQQERYSRFTARIKTPSNQFKEAWLICGRRAGKSRIAALVAVFLACFRDYSKYLAPGERGTVVVIAADRKQARVIFRYVKGLIEAVPFLKARIESDRAEAIDFNNNITIEVHTASFRAVRGYSLVAAICDEIAFWRSEETSANPDEEILNGLRPGLGTIPRSMLICLSSPWARQGVMWKAFKKHYGKDESKVLVWNATTQDMNPIFSQDIIAEAFDDDAAKAGAEYGGMFRKDIESYVTQDVLDSIIVADRHELEQSSSVGKYFAFVDPSGGTSDSMTLAIAHRNIEIVAGKTVKTVVLDCLREVAPRNGPFSPEAVVEEFADVLRDYNVTRVVGDRYGGEWPKEQFKKRGITYEPAELTKSELYKEFLPIMNSGNVELLDNGKMRNQLLALERTTRRAGKEQIDHPPGGHDDVCLVGETLIATRNGFCRIDCVKVGEEVLTHLGWRKVLWSGKTGDKLVISRFGLCGTPSHPVKFKGSFTTLDSINGVVLPSWVCLIGLIRSIARKQSSSVKFCTDGWEAVETITSVNQQRIVEEKKRKGYTSLFGKPFTVERFLKDLRSTTEIITRLTTILTIWIVLLKRSIGANLKEQIQKRSNVLLNWLAHHQLSKLGIKLHEVALGVGSWFVCRLRHAVPIHTSAFALNAVSLINPFRLGQSFARHFAENENGYVELRELLKVSARSAESISGNKCSEETKTHDFVRAVAVPEAVFNLKVEEAETFYANGILVHNCNVTAGVSVVAYGKRKLGCTWGKTEAA